MASINLKGMGVALVTPFKADKSIDFDALGRIIEYQIQNGVDYLVVLGTTSENPTLSADEREAIKNFVADRVADRVPMVLGVGGNNTAAVVSEARTVDTRRFRAILSVVPYYNKPSQGGIYRHQCDGRDHPPTCRRIPPYHSHQGGFGQYGAGG